MHDIPAAEPWTDVKRFPRLIPLGRPTERPELPPLRAPAGAASASDLPPELFIGYLRAESFTSDRAGWHARYEGTTPDTCIDVTYERSNGALTASQVWRGVQGPVTTVMHNSWPELGAAFVLGAPADWEALLQRRLAGRYHIHYVIGPVEPRQYILFPTALFDTILCPVPLAHLHRAVDAMRAIRADSAVGRTGPAHLEWTVSAVNYLEGRCPDVPGDPMEAAAFTAERIGLPPTERPAWKGRPDGERALTVRRAHHNLVLSCAFADVERVVEHLHRARVVGGVRAGDGAESYVTTPEFRAVVLPADVRWHQIQFFDADRTRRITYVSYERLWGRTSDRDGAWHPHVQPRVIEVLIEAARRAAGAAVTGRIERRVAPEDTANPARPK